MRDGVDSGPARARVGTDAKVDKGAGDWKQPRPETIPRPTYWPAVLAFGSALIAFGVQTSYLLSAVGAAIFVFATAGWIGEMRHEQQKRSGRRENSGG